MAAGEQNESESRIIGVKNCPVRGVFDEATSRWATTIMAALLTGPHRFVELRDRLDGISEKMLTQKLKAMVRAGLVAREVTPTVPAQVTYRLTELGSSLAGPLNGLLRWFGEHGDELSRAQRAYDATD